MLPRKALSTLFITHAGQTDSGLDHTAEKLVASGKPISYADLLLDTGEPG